MIERYYSGDYSKRFCAVCDVLELPFWGIDCTYEDKIARPFGYEPGSNIFVVGGRGDAHSDLFWETRNEINSSTCIRGRLWDFNRVTLLTFWTEEHEKTFLSADVLSHMIEAMSKNNIKLKNPKIVFEAYDDDSLKQWYDNRDSDGFFIYSITVDEYISTRMSSFEDVVQSYNIQEKKQRRASSVPSDRYAEYGGYLPYKLLRYQSDESKMNTDKSILNENVLAETLPDDIKGTLLSNTTSLGNNPAIPDVYDTPFLLKLANARFESIKDTLMKIGTIDDFEDTEIGTMLPKLIKKCQEIERQFRPDLEKLCVNYVIDTFKVPEDMVQINVELVDTVNLEANSIIVDPIDGDDEIEFDDVAEATNIRGEVYKRRLLEALCMGEAISLSSDIDSYKETIEEISPELCELYYKIIALNNYSLYTSDDIGITDEDKKLLGTVNVEFGNSNQQVRITAQGKIFPILLSETIRGFMELFISHGLPQDVKLADIIIGKSDFVKAEPWDMRLGPSLWMLLSKSFNDITLTELPYLLKRIASLDVDKFNFLMKEVFARTKKGKQIMSKICNKAKNDIEYDRFTDKMSKMSIDKSIIIDEFINEDEL